MFSIGDDVMIYHDNGINWTWYLEADTNEDERTINIKRLWRLHNYSCDNHPSSDEAFYIIEDKQRIVQAIRLNGAREYRLVNPISIYELMK